jgi:intergrase/recombinase
MVNEISLQPHLLKLRRDEASALQKQILDQKNKDAAQEVLRSLSLLLPPRAITSVKPD